MTQLYFLLMPKSVAKLFDLLSLFESCSALKINQTKSEMLWLASMHYGKDTILDLQMSGETVYALGVHFTYDLDVSKIRIFTGNIEYVVQKRPL